LIFGGEQGDFGMRFEVEGNSKMLEALDRGIHGYFPFSHSGRLRGIALMTG